MYREDVGNSTAKSVWYFNLFLSFIHPQRVGFGEIFPEVMIKF